MNHRPLNVDATEGDLAAPEGVNAKLNAEMIKVQKWRCPGGLAAVDSEIVQGDEQAPRIKMELMNIDKPASHRGQLPDHRAPHIAIGPPAPQEADHGGGNHEN